MRHSLSTDLRLRLDALPTQPGVYLMRDAGGRIIYVGKAKSLRSRVRSYFQKEAFDGRPQFLALIAKIADVECIITETEQEALILEANQIKAHKPRYNINLKDDKKYPFIRITAEPYPRIFSTRDIIRDGSRYLGPFSNVRSMRTAMDVMHRIFPVRSCDYALPSDRVKLCMEHQIRRCEGPCEDLVDQEEYGRTVSQAVRFLKGRNGEVIRELESHMEVASRERHFEQAARYRDQLKALRLMQSRQKVVLDEPIDRDVIGLARSDDEACCAVLEIREGRLVDQKHHFLSGVMEREDDEVVSAFVRQFYLQTDFIPRQIHLSVKVAESEAVAAWLTSKAEGRVDLFVGQRGIKARTQDMADSNAANLLHERQLKREMQKDRVPQSVFALQRDLGLDRPPRRIEGIDISNFQGTDTVGSLVCMVDGKPRRSEYRHFRVRGVEGSDDFASVREVVSRRFRGLQERGESPPDLLMIDGGKGQLSSARAVLVELDMEQQSVVGLAKRLEEVFLPGEDGPLLLPKTSASLRLLQVLRDEAHRFAVEYHRKLRSKRTLTSGLDRIPGIGPKRRQALLSEFGSIKRLREADVQQIAAVKGFSLKLAQDLKSHLGDREPGTPIDTGGQT
ncbi:excinuclease ABC subunit UvrC [Candidatus Latescibacterota bacterium]